MAFDPDSYLAAKQGGEATGGGFDPDAYLKSKGAPAPAARLASTDAGPEARRAASLRPPGPRPLTAEQAGTMSGPQTEAITRVGPAAILPGQSFEAQREALSVSEQPAADESFENFAFMASMIPAGAAGKIAGGAAGSLAGKVLPRAVAPALVPVASGAAAGAAASKTMGGDATTGALLGGAFGALPGVANVVAGGAKRAVGDITRGARKAPARLTNEVKFKAGEEGATLAEVLTEIPVARRAVTVKAKTNPAAAAKDLDGVINKAVDANDAAYAAMQRQHGGVPLQPIAEKLAGLEERLNLQGRGVAADAVNRVRTDLLKRYGSSPEGLETAKLTAQQIRNIRNDMGTVADPARTIKPNTRRQALGKIYQVLNQEIDDVAANTSGVKLDEFKQRNRQISTLIPVRDALKHRAEAEAEMSLGAKIKRIPGDVVRRGARELDDTLSVVEGTDVVRPVSAANAQRERFPGQVEMGNIDLTNRPHVKNADGSTSTIRSLGVNIDGKEVLIPTVSDDGRIMTDDEAVEQYKRTGRHLGKFKSVEASNAAARALHEEQAQMLGES